MIEVSATARPATGASGRGCVRAAVPRASDVQPLVEAETRGIEGCYWSINPESGDTAGWYGHAYDPVSNTSGWGEWRPFDQRKTNLLNRLWGR